MRGSTLLAAWVLGFVAPSELLADFNLAPVPGGITSRSLIFRPNDLQDPVTAEKPNWVMPPHVTRPPLLHNWLVNEHAFIQTGPDRFLLVSLEMNFNFLLSPGGGFVEAFNFVEWDGVNLPTSPTLPTSEQGYWRGNTQLSHPYVWAPHLYEEDGTFYLFYPAPWPNTTSGKLACFLATSTTGDGDPADWIQYDPDPLTAEIEPLFEAPASSRGFRDFHITPIPKEGGGFTYHNYFISDTYDPELGAITGDPQQGVSETWLRVSDDLLVWPEAGQVEQAFRRVNADWTGPERYNVDYENPNVIRLDENNWYLFISRHGMFPKQSVKDADPNWTVHPQSTEVYWSPDGLNFSLAHQMPNLKTSGGGELNSIELFKWNERWFVTEAQYANTLEHTPFDACPDGGGNFTCHSQDLIRLMDTLTQPEHSLHLVEIEFAQPASAQDFWMYE